MQVKIDIKSQDTSSDFTFSLPGHWIYLFVCHFNSTESIQSCSHFGALNLSYTLPPLIFSAAGPREQWALLGKMPSLFYQVFIFTWVKWSIWEWNDFPKNTKSKLWPKIAQSGVRNRAACIDICKRLDPNHYPISLSIAEILHYFLHMRRLPQKYF